ncbi:hypothetical protein ADU20_26230 [Burkholderia pseudomallei]|nr:hypothetical protein ADU20_26230 [Burkholderia pseudomallei]
MRARAGLPAARRWPALARRSSRARNRGRAVSRPPPALAAAVDSLALLAPCAPLARRARLERPERPERRERLAWPERLARLARPARPARPAHRQARR